jgi:murein DD-endopeptidase MepM/ murein hydrolase activator NlpD
MRPSVRSVPSRYLSRVAVAALLAGLAAGCSSDTSRFAADPFSNPFASQPQQTASIPTTSAYPTSPVQSRPLASANSRPIAAQPLPPVGSVGTQPAARSPLPAYGAGQGGRAAVTTGSVSNSPRVGGFSKGGWSAEGGTAVVAQAGDTVETLSNRYGVPADAIMAANGLTGAYLAPGQRVTIPVYSVKTATAQRPVAPLRAPTPPAIVAPRPQAHAEPVVARAAEPAPALQKSVAAKPEQKIAANGSHVVAPGETLISIAEKYGTTRPKLAEMNGIDQWANVRIGQKLKVPGGAQAETKPAAKPVKSAADTASPAQQETKQARTVATPSAEKTVKTVAITPAEKATPAAAASAAKPAIARIEKPKSPAVVAPEDGGEETSSLPAAPKADAAQPEEKVVAKQDATDQPQFRWPVRGRVIQAFGQNSDGINISVPEGTEVKAAENGVVAYAGNELKGYGNLILIRHADGFVTAYAHAKDLNVKRGDTVKRGQTIATAGQTGNVTSPQLLFELRRGATPVDPRQFLPST